MPTEIIVGAFIALLLIALVAIGKAVEYHNDVQLEKSYRSDLKAECDSYRNRFHDLNSKERERTQKKERKRTAQNAFIAQQEAMNEAGYRESLKAARRLAEYQEQANIDVDRQRRIDQNRANIAVYGPQSDYCQAVKATTNDAAPQAKTSENPSFPETADFTPTTNES